jgi:hypothetical protein
MGSFKTRPVSTLLLLGLLAWIAYVLIAPEIDLLDTAFQSDSAPLTIHAQMCHAQHGKANVSAHKLTFPSANASRLSLEVFFSDRPVEVPSVPHQILRC